MPRSIKNSSAKTWLPKYNLDIRTSHNNTEYFSWNFTIIHNLDWNETENTVHYLYVTVPQHSWPESEMHMKPGISKKICTSKKKNQV